MATRSQASADHHILMRHRRRVEHAARIAAFADLIADGVELPDAARRLGQKPSWAVSTFAKMRREFGEQSI